MPEPLDLVGFDAISSGISTFADAGQRYVYVPALRLPSGCTPAVAAALICMDPRDNYPTRLFLSEKVSTTARQLNWNTSVAIAGQTWHSFSWNYVPSSTRPVEVLIGHLAAFLP
jgi:hypothetical protein